MELSYYPSLFECNRWFQTCKKKLLVSFLINDFLNLFISTREVWEIAMHLIFYISFKSVVYES